MKTILLLACALSLLAACSHAQQPTPSPTPVHWLVIIWPASQPPAQLEGVVKQVSTGPRSPPISYLGPFVIGAGGEEKTTYIAHYQNGRVELTTGPGAPPIHYVSDPQYNADAAVFFLAADYPPSNIEKSLHPAGRPAVAPSIDQMVREAKRP